MDGEAIHAPHLDLLPTDAGGRAPMATHVAVRDGDWFEASTWANGTVPGAGALVHIPRGVSVDYDGASAARLFIVRVDGALSLTAENGAATRMVFDTIVTAPGSTFRVDAKAETDGTVDIVFAEGRPAAHGDHYTDRSPGDGVIGRHDWDPAQLSLGLVAAGRVEVHGQQIESSLTMYRGPAAGATRMVLETPGGDPGWEVGQKIVIGGMGYNGLDADERLATEDEVRVITGVRDFGDRIMVEFDRPLEYSHRGPVDPATGQEVAGKVGNLDRNVTFSSAVADRDGDGMADRGVSLGEARGAGEHYVTERGHVMFMHNDDIAFTNSSLFGLGRTDKSTDVDDYVLGGDGNHRLHEDAGRIGQYDPGVDMAIATAPEELMNQRGRYALHVHQAGTGEEDGHSHGAGGGMGSMAGVTGGSGGPAPCPAGDGIGDCDHAEHVAGAWIEGNVVWGSPGWGIVQHDSAAVLKDNLVFDVAGAAFVAESGSETGRWQGNLAIGTYGAGERPEGDDASDFNEDSGYAGNGFYLKSRAIELVDNTAHSSARAGFYYHNHGVEYADTPSGALGDIAVADGAKTVASEDVPIRVFEDNAVFAAKQGIRLVTDPLDSVRKFNDAWSHLKNFTAVEVDESGVSITYSSKYVFENFRIFGTAHKVTEDAQRASAGFFFKASAADLTVLGGHVENFANAVTNWSMIGDRQEYRRGYWDPKNPTSDSPDTPRHEGMGAVEGIENPAWNLWDTNIVGLSTARIDGVRWRIPSMEVETAPGVYQDMSGGKVLGSAAHAPNAPGVGIELLGDSRDGGLVALWRERLANDPDQGSVLARQMPLAYRESEYLSQLWFQDGSHVRRRDFQEATQGLNADIWSGTALEFAKTDGLGRKVFLYGDFSPLNPAAATRTQTTNEKILFTREMIDGVLLRDGYMTVGGIDDVRFVVMKMAFTDRLTGEIENKQFLVALDRAWQIPAAARDAGLLLITNEMIVAPQYRVFHAGNLVAGRAPIVFDEAGGLASGKSIGASGVYTTDGANSLSLGSRDDKVRGGDGDDRVLAQAGHDSISGGDGDDRLFGGTGDDLLEGDGGNDFLGGGAGRDILRGGDGGDTLAGGGGGDMLAGGDGNDVLFGNADGDMLLGEAGDDTLDGGDGDDMLIGGDGRDGLFGGAGNDLLFGGPGDDLLRGGAGRDALSGGAGRDTLDGGAGADLLEGGDGGDRLLGADGADTLKGNAGADHLSGGNDADQLFGGDDNDRLEGGEGDDTLFGGRHDDRLMGGGGDDLLHGEVGHDELRGGTGRDTLVGSTGNDRLFGDAGNDVLLGQQDDDRMHGGDGDDYMDGGIGDDRLSAGAGADILIGGAGADWLNGGPGDDRVQGGAGADSMRGGAGQDTLHGGGQADWLAGDDGADRLFGGDGDDRLRGGADGDLLMGEAGNDRMFGDGGDDRLEGAAGDDMAMGGAGDDLLIGGQGNDFLNGDAGRDHLRGGDGRDTLAGSAGEDRLFGGAGEDVLLGQQDGDELHGEDDDDYMDGGAGDDLLFGGAGDDRLIGGAGTDRLSGGAGDDRLQGGSGEDRLDGGRGRDTLQGGSEADRLEGGDDDDLLFGGHGTDTLRGDGGNDTLWGDNGDDLLMGDAGRDELHGGEGGDTLAGGAGDDTLFGGAGRDVLRGERNDDALFGGDDADYLDGGDGDDRLFGDDGADYLIGGAGRDRLAGGAGDDQLQGGAGDDRLSGGTGRDVLQGGTGADLLMGEGGDDRLFGGAGDDLLMGDAGRDELHGGEGQDTLTGSAGDDRLFGGAGADVLLGQQHDDELRGGGDDDYLDGGAGDDRLFGDDGDDHLIGGPGSDRLSGGAGNDLLQGGSGEDLLGGGIGNDILQGGAGADLLEGDDGDDRLFGGHGTDTLRGNAGDDMLAGGNGNDLLTGDDGADRLMGEDGDDTLLGGEGDDLLLGGNDNDLLLGNAGSDRMLGGEGQDSLIGGEGNDRLDGGDGDDRLEGGAGQDRFVFDDTAGTDVITDFEDGVDAIDFLIDSFGFEDLAIAQDGADAVLTHAGGTIRLLETDAGLLDASDFTFHSTA